MSEELDILRIVADNPSISQRKIAEKTGISLGQVNFLIKKCVKKGLIKIEGQTTKSIRYNLTPVGLTEKAQLTLEYIKISYGAIMAISNKLKNTVQKYSDKRIFIYGPNDEVMELLKMSLEEEKISYSLIKDPEVLSREINVQEGAPSTKVLFYWVDVPNKTNNMIFVNILE